MIDPDIVKDITENYNDIVSILRKTLLENGIEPIKFYLWQGRARGKAGDDIDIYIQVDDRHSSLVNNLDFLNQKLRNKYESSGYHWIYNGLLMDTRIGIGIPSDGPYFDLDYVNRAYIRETYFPQWEYLDFTDIFNVKNVKAINHEMINVKVISFMISCPWQNMLTGYQHKFYRSKLDEVIYRPRCEILFGTNIEPHDVTHEKFGTQPFGSYLRGHINLIFGIIVDGKWITRNIDEFRPFITIQQYYKSDKMLGVDFLEQQLDITTFGIRKMLDVGLIYPKTLVNLENHSHPWDQYKCHPLIFIPAKKIVDLYDKLSRDKVMERWRTFAEYGISHVDKEKALRCFDI